MNIQQLPAQVESLTLPSQTVVNESVVVPTVKGSWILKYGEHAYYFMNFRTSSGFRLQVSHLDIMGQGLKKFKAIARQNGLPVSVFRCLATRYHYGFNVLEQIMLMTVPHTVTSVGKGCFLVSLWSYFGFLVVNCQKQTIAYHTLDDAENGQVLGSRQWHDPQSGELYAMSYSLADSLARIRDPQHRVSFKIFKHRLESNNTETVWSGELSDFMHDILLTSDRQYVIACELGMYQDGVRNILPSKVLIFDLMRQRQWVIDRFIVAAHACLDPVDPDLVYFSNHNFEFQHSHLLQLIRKGSYSVHFRGPASIFKYQLTPEGPRELGVFTQPDFYRLTNMHVFIHRGQKVIAAMGFPDIIFLINADDMRAIRKICIKDPVSPKHFYSRKPSLIGTFSPSLDGEKLYVQTTRSFQRVDINSGHSDLVRDDFFTHICFNHMMTSSDTDWNGNP